MTDKKIIIDSIDVNGCPDISGHVNDFGEYECLCRCIFGDGSDDYGVIGHEMCKDNPNCHYKQLKRKEQECERLKLQYKELEQCSKKLKDYYDKEKETLSNRFLELKQTLIDIKEIAEECYYECNSMHNCNISCKYYNDCNGEFSYLLAYLNKQISEVENDNK